MKLLVMAAMRIGPPFHVIARFPLMSRWDRHARWRGY